MEFDEAIEEMMKASTEFKQAVETACVKLSERYTELTEKPAPPERKIDHPTLKGWSISAGNGHVYDEYGGDVNWRGKATPRELCSRVIVNAPGTMAELIDWVNEWYSHGDAIVAPDWMRDGMIRLRQRVIDADFGCDLD